MSQPAKNSCVSQFLLNPSSTVKVVATSAALAVVLHKTAIKESSLRGLTLGLTLLNAFWFATTLNMTIFESPLLANVPSLDNWKMLDVGRHRLSWISKMEAVTSILSASLYFNWHHRIVSSNGFIDGMLKAAVLAPMAISTFQSIYYIPHLLKITNSVDKGELTTEQLWHSGSNLVQRHRQYLALDTVKVACLGLAGWRFGKMLEH